MDVSKIKTYIIFAGDVIIFYASLLVSLYLRYYRDVKINLKSYFNIHFEPFSLIFIIWIIVFYLADLYDPRKLKNNAEFFKSFIIALVINGLIGALFFYLFPFYGITPKTVLFLFLGIFGIFSFLWRYFFNYFGSAIGSKEKVLIISAGHDPLLAKELIDYVGSNPQLGYEIKCHLEEKDDYSKLNKIIEDNKIGLVIIPTLITEKLKLSKIIYENLSLGINIMNLSEFYELIFKKIPLSELEESWFLENIVHLHKIYDSLKTPVEILAALLMVIVLLPLFFIIAFFVKITSKGPAIYRQTRVGKNEKLFTLYKFRTMAMDAEKSGPQWAKQNDPRITRVGKFLRYTHLDELPQLINVIKGNVSFVGPRPERPEFVRELKEKISYYEIRHLLKPGITGWAQINYRYGASVEDAVQKLQYEIYYLKNRSVVIDLLIILKTIKLFFTNLK